MNEQRHDPTYLAGGGRRWATCSYGWKSALFRSPTGAQIAFGAHLVRIERSTP